MANTDPVFTPRKVTDENQNLNNEQIRIILQTILSEIKKLQQEAK